MEQKYPSSYGLKTQLSLASLMFFGPFIKHLLHENTLFDLDEEGKTFVKGYMLLGGINLGLAVICTILGLSSKFINSEILEILFIVFSSLLLFFLIGGSIAVFANISLNKNTDTNLTDSIVTDLTSNNAIHDYIPFFNSYLWYSIHDFDGTYPIIKESLLVWTVFAILCFTGNIWLIGISLILIIVRIVTLTIIGDVFKEKGQTIINTLFHKNIEEIRGWIMGGFVGYLSRLFGGKIRIEDKQQEWQGYYSYLYDLKKYGSIQRQYVLALLMTGYLLFIGQYHAGFGLIILGTILLWGRYILMAILWGHLPPLPLIHDIFHALESLFEKKIPTNKK